MASVTQLGYLGIGVSDMAQWEPFATEILGLQIGARGDDGTLFLRMDDYHHRIALHPGGDDDLNYVGWEVVDEHALQAVADQLRAAGTKVTVGTAAEAEVRRVVGLIRFDDPSGVPSEIYYGPMQSFDAPFVSPRGVAGFVTGTMGFGHIVIAVDDLDQSIDFYRDVLGLRISDFIQLERPPGNRFKMAFFHCNPRHHSLAFMAMKPDKRLNHFMLQAQSINDVGTTYDLC